MTEARSQASDRSSPSSVEREREVRQQLTRILKDQLQLEVPSEDTDLVDAGVLDSLLFVELLMHMESTFQIRIAFEHLALSDLRSIAAMAAFVLRSESSV